MNDFFVSNRDIDHGMVELSSEGIDLVSGGVGAGTGLPDYLLPPHSGINGLTGRTADHLGEEPQQLEAEQDFEQTIDNPGWIMSL